MSRIDELIAELVPDGVRYLPIDKLFHLRNGYTPSKSNAEFWSGGTIPWFRMEDIRASGGVLSNALQRIPEVAVKGGELFPANSLLVATSATIGEHALVTVPHLSNQRFTSLTVKAEYADQVEMKFFYYYGFVLDEWCRNNTTTSSFSSVDMSGFKKFKFPIPPLKVQREIVRILDQFTQLEAELEAELEARLIQFEYYRQRLLDNLDAEPVALGHLGTWYGGMTPSKANPAYWDSGDVPWLASMDVSDTSTDGIRGRVTSLALEETPLRIIPAPSIAVVMRSNILRRKLPIGLIKIDTTVNQDMRMLVPHDSVSIEYVYQVLQAESERIRSTCVRTDGSMAAVDSKSFLEWMIPLPDLDEQQRIAIQLRNFDTLVNDLTSGLPAELAARRKQYEYYRDKLLAFDEAV
ncbi:MAG TPA: restriction endonuclease subunit S [Trueperaceae bacterium]|nr:restriction endonuclease subunit S [Trueperaceae bacterium]